MSEGKLLSELGARRARYLAIGVSAAALACSTTGPEPQRALANEAGTPQDASETEDARSCEALLTRFRRVPWNVPAGSVACGADSDCEVVVPRIECASGLYLELCGLALAKSRAQFDAQLDEIRRDYCGQSCRAALTSQCSGVDAKCQSGACVTVE